MKHLIESFQNHVGERGTHFYDETACTFLSWNEVFQFLGTLPDRDQKCAFSEKLTETLANYDPNVEFLAVQQLGSQVSVEVYSSSRKSADGNI